MGQETSITSQEAGLIPSNFSIILNSLINKYNLIIKFTQPFLHTHLYDDFPLTRTLSLLPTKFPLFVNKKHLRWIILTNSISPVSPIGVRTANLSGSGPSELSKMAICLEITLSDWFIIIQFVLIKECINSWFAI